MDINPTIFREYDIRGVAGKEFTPEAIAEFEKWYGAFPGITITLEAAEAIGKGYGTIIRRGGGRNVVVGHEVRPFADELTAAFVVGVRSTGCDVTDLGIAITPLVYFTVAAGGYDGGVNVTGSHNVYFYNGFKMMKKDVWPLFSQELQSMRELITREDFARGAGEYRTFDGFPAYRDYIVSHTKLPRPLKLVVDYGNGSAGRFGGELFSALGCEVIELYAEPDATFPNHLPDPEDPFNMRELGERVQQKSADLGIAFDADGDRVGFVAENGEFVPADLVTLTFARDVLHRHPGKKILFDVASSALLSELIPAFGGVPLMHRIGHAPIKETLRRDPDIIFGGEVSSHFYLVEDYFKIDDGPAAAARLLQLLAASGGKCSDLFAKFPRRIKTPVMKLPCRDEEKFAIVARIADDLDKHYPAIRIDGVRIRVGEKGWGLIRASNTSPHLTVWAEGEAEIETIAIKNILADALEKHPGVTDRLNRTAVATRTGRLGWV